MLFSSVDNAAAYLEAIDVERGAFTGYDSEGRLLNLTTEDVPTRVLFWNVRLGEAIVHISSAEEAPTHQDYLIQILREYLGRPAGSTDRIVPALPDVLGQLRAKDGFVL
jgi:hypothetical protein